MFLENKIKIDVILPFGSFSQSKCFHCGKGQQIRKLDNIFQILAKLNCKRVFEKRHFNSHYENSKFIWIFNKCSFNAMLFSDKTSHLVAVKVFLRKQIKINTSSVTQMKSNCGPAHQAKIVRRVFQQRQKFLLFISEDILKHICRNICRNNVRLRAEYFFFFSKT